MAPCGFYSIILKHLKYLCSLLNSKLIKFWLKKCGKLQRNNYQLDSEPLMKIPIYNCDNELSSKIESLFNMILDCPNDYKIYSDKIDSIIFGDLSYEKKRIAIKKLKSKGLSKEHIGLFVKLLDYINEF